MVYQRYATVRKISQKRLNTEVMQRQIDYIVKRMLSAGRKRQWEVRATYPSSYTYTDTVEGLEYEGRLSIERKGYDRSASILDEQLKHILALANTAGNASGWEVEQTDTVPEEKKAEEQEHTVTVTPTSTFFQPKLTDESLTRNGYFDHIYEREPQISLIDSSLRAFVHSGLRNRFHCCLWGAPACGKTEILRSFSKMLGPELVLELDATSTTKAGAERIILESEVVPPVMIVEEIEKTDEASLRWLLGVLDHRGEIRKTTNRGMKTRNVKMLCLATVNDMNLFKRVMDGALASRFSQKIWCPRPSRNVLRMILSREVANVGGNPAWIEPAIDWCVDEEDTNDPRRVVTVCLSGREDLLTGKYQNWLRQTMEPED